MRVAQLWRYPVKSLQGERLDVADLDEDGIAGDRCWAIRDVTSGKVLTARREPRLLYAVARLTAAGDPVVLLPDGSAVVGTGSAVDAALSDWLGRRVTICAPDAAVGAVGDFFDDPTDDISPTAEWTMPPGRFVDAMPLLVVTTASLRTAAALHPAGDWEVRRFRPNVVVDVDGDGWVEDGWCGDVVQIGIAAVGPQQECMRCTMVTRPQPGGLPDDRDIFRTLARHHGGHFGVWSTTVTDGRVHVGDAVAVIPRPRAAAETASLAAEQAR